MVAFVLESSKAARYVGNAVIDTTTPTENTRGSRVVHFIIFKHKTFHLQPSPVFTLIKSHADDTRLQQKNHTSFYAWP